MEARRQREEKRKRQEEEENRKRKERIKKKQEEQRREEEEEKRKREEKNRKIYEEEKIFEEFNKKKQEINNYFALLPFYDEINNNYDLSIKINTNQRNLIKSYEEKLIDYFNSKIKDKYREWDEQIKRAKWKLPVQAQGELKCKKGCNLTDTVICKECKGNLYWVDSDAKYAICKNCENNGIRKIGNQLFCDGCGAESLCTPKWIIGYKP